MCGTSFERNRSQYKDTSRPVYCSLLCFGKTLKNPLRKKRRPDIFAPKFGWRVKNSCLTCLTNFFVVPSHAATENYCSARCRHLNGTKYRTEQARRQSKCEASRRRRLLKRANTLSGRFHTLEDWQRIVERAKHHCAMCGCDGPLTRDHIVPVTLGGSDEPENIQPLCQSCNSTKRASCMFLAFDLGTTIGWAKAHEFERPRFGFERLSGDRDDGAVGLAFTLYLEHQIVHVRRPTLIGYEIPILYPTQITAMRRLIGLEAMLLTTCRRFNVPVRGYHLSTVRKSFLAPGDVPRERKDVKSAVLLRCRELGWQTESEDAGDALAVLDYMRTTLYRDFPGPAERTGLWQKRKTSTGGTTRTG